MWGGGKGTCLQALGVYLHPHPPPSKALSVGATGLPRKEPLPRGQESRISASALSVVRSHVPGQMHHHSDPQSLHLESEHHIVSASQGRCEEWISYRCETKCFWVLIRIRRKGKDSGHPKRSVGGLRERILHFLQGLPSVWPYFLSQTGCSGLPSFNPSAA